MTPLGLPLDAWAMIAAVLVLWGLGAFLWRRNRSLAAGALLLGTLIGLAFLYFLSLGGFCVPPPGSACL